MVPCLWTWACIRVDCHWTDHLQSAQILQEMFASRRLHCVKRMKVRSNFGVLMSCEVALLQLLLRTVAEHPGLLEVLDLGGPRLKFFMPRDIRFYSSCLSQRFINLSQVDENNLLPKAVTNVSEVTFSEFSLLSKQQTTAIFAALLESSSVLKRLNMYRVDLSFVDEPIITYVINNLQEVDLTGAKMTCLQVTALLTLMIECSNLKKFNLDIDTHRSNRHWYSKTDGRPPINGVDPILLAEALTHLEEVKLPAGLNRKQVITIFAFLDTFHGRLKRLDISGGDIFDQNDLAPVDAVLIANVVNKFEAVDITYTNLTVSHTYAILKQISTATSLKKFFIVGNERRKFRRQTKRMEKLYDRARQVIPITDLWRTWHCKHLDS